MNPPPRRPGRDAGLVRPSTITGGRTAPSRNTIDHATLVLPPTNPPDQTDLGPEQQRVLRLCEPGVLSAAEISAHLDLPISVLTILISQLKDSGHVTTRSPVPPAALPDRQLLEEVLSGLRRLRT
ncbi:DUF742 domain-containing protein [Streptomyces calidiresistens]|uniref:DUF742 domain-containing protein n=1 Tax=Streptomyces calidiresistens TaxID=1485586 RepID=A0A7W3T635_9ACTN|nr:DUF742 domain-containing protein [Streptomyces calidiresistens]MBB0231619.1 DUF742 domain-containing protein [Streptomyces calidiresistens]